MRTKAMKRAKCLKSHTERQPSPVVAESAEKEVPPHLYSRDLEYHRERAIAQAKIAEINRWMFWEAAKDGKSMDDAILPITLYIAFLEWHLFARVLVGWECRNEGKPAPHVEIPDKYYLDPDDKVIIHRPRTASEAIAMGLDFIEDAPAASYPGCRGVDIHGKCCAELRLYGKEYCPGCENRREYEEWESRQ